MHTAAPRSNSGNYVRCFCGFTVEIIDFFDGHQYIFHIKLRLIYLFSNIQTSVSKYCGIYEGFHGEGERLRRFRKGHDK